MVRVLGKVLNSIVKKYGFKKLHIFPFTMLKPFIPPYVIPTLTSWSFKNKSTSMYAKRRQLPDYFPVFPEPAHRKLFQKNLPVVQIRSQNVMQMFKSVQQMENVLLLKRTF